MDSKNTEAFQQEFRGVMGQLPTGVSVLLAAVDGSIHAMTVGSVVLASTDPPLVAVFVSRKSRMHGHLLRARCFTISVLGADDSLSARRFARRAGESEGSYPVPAEMVNTENGQPVLRGAISWLECEVGQVARVGDHSCLVGKVVGMGRSHGAQPLIYHRGRFHSLGPSVSAGQHVPIDPAETLTNW